MIWQPLWEKEQKEQERPEEQMEQIGGSKCCITRAEILKLYISQMMCLPVFFQETEILSGVEGITQHCNGQAILWSLPAMFLIPI